MILYSSFKLKSHTEFSVAHRIRCKAGQPTENRCTRSNDVDHLQNRMINIFERHAANEKRNAHRNCYSCVDAMKIGYAAHGVFSAWVEKINRLKRQLKRRKSDNHDRLPRFMAMPIVDVVVAVIINGANTRNRSTCLRTVCFYSLLFTYDFFTRLAMLVFFLFFLTNWILLCARPLPYLGELQFYLHCDLDRIIQK